MSKQDERDDLLDALNLANDTSIRYLGQISALKQENEALKGENERLLKGIKMAHLHLLASRCECGEPLKETDAFDCLDALLEEQADG